VTTALEAIYLIAHVNSALAFQIRLVLDNQVRHGARHTPHKNAVEVREDQPPRVGHTGRMGLVQLDISRIIFMTSMLIAAAIAGRHC